MAQLGNLNLIHLLDFYLALAFLISLYLRIRQYRAIVGLVFTVPGRWPRLFRLVKDHRTIFLTWSTLLPALLALALWALQTAASRFIWPALTDSEANLTVAMLFHQWPAWLIVTLLGLLMLGVDGYCTFDVGDVNRNELEKYFDQAEYWLRSWAAPVVRIFTLGFINPRRMVAVEVRVALLDASRMLNTALWWTTAQIGVRVVFAMGLWATYFVSRPGP
jgi:hypothetical protein